MSNTTYCRATSVSETCSGFPQGNLLSTKFRNCDDYQTGILIYKAGERPPRAKTKGALLKAQGDCDSVQKVERAVGHMLQNVNRSLRISTLSAMTGGSISHFYRLFKLGTGFSPMDFFIRLRVQYACELLQNRILSVKQIATLLGYNDPCYFSRVFKRITGVAPRYYRNRVVNSPPRQLRYPPMLDRRLNPQTPC